MFNLNESNDFLPVPEIKTPTALDVLKAEWLTSYDQATMPAGKLSQVPVPRRESIVDVWFKEGDLGFIYGPRGLGKTWLALLLARKCAEGGQLANWIVGAPRRVLYVDGEMPMDGIRQRDEALATTPTENMFYLQHEALFHLTGKVLNLAEPSSQAAILEKCRRDKIDVIFFDNLSCLFSGIKENDADAWEQVLPWLLDLRRNRIAVVFIAHAGRNGFMRGTSRREDAAFWIINLREAKDESETQNGARFIAEFVKNRNATENECPAYEWRFETPAGQIRAEVSWRRLTTFQQFRQCIEDGLTTATDIAIELDLSVGQVSRMAKKAIKAGWLKKEGREYALVDRAE
jgi:hypothetical protein